MKSPTLESSDGLLRDPTDFSLVLGGPLFQLLRRSHLSDDAMELVRLRVIVISLLAWLPLLVLSALEGQLLGGSAAVRIPSIHLQEDFPNDEPRAHRW
jgi:hypothetical protein